MVQVSAVRLELAKLQYQWMLNDMRLKVLTGEWLLQ